MKVHFGPIYDIPVEIGAKIREKRREIGVTMEEVAGHIGVTRQTMGKLERGILCIGEGKLIILARLMGFEPLFLWDLVSGYRKLSQSRGAEWRRNSRAWRGDDRCT